MSLFMGKFVEEVNNFGHVIWRTACSVIKSTIHAICCCVDAPARAAVMSMVQFNGLFGCPWCYACGEHHERGQRYMNVVADEQRTPESVLRDMKFAIEVSEPVNGLKGPSPLARLKGFDLVLGQTVNYMHCVLLGVTKCFADTWFDSSNHQEPYYIGILPQRHLNHFVLLVEAVHILLLEELTAPQLQRAGSSVSAGKRPPARRQDTRKAPKQPSRQPEPAAVSAPRTKTQRRSVATWTHQDDHEAPRYFVGDLPWKTQRQLRREMPWPYDHGGRRAVTGC
ncbi:hypothetical protein HPB52_000080 [Rhipicephalus sanguineus]|uniref:Uncharacterized protein n=1 Tax=Rhipicephalus sanguineus TaxID=34632 RepID=A0A9D4PT87_RHISA|nr:hypothetical protein HPB52_000080 [Rhipicephalus sanguineus]